jgi:hypothetical protein
MKLNHFAENDKVFITIKNRFVHSALGVSNYRFAGKKEIMLDNELDCAA